MSEVANSGRTVLFVSHNMQAVSALTKKCILLNDGMIEYFGDTNAAIQKYLCNSNEIYINLTKQDYPHIKKVEIHSSESTNIHQVFKPFAITFDIETNQLLKGAAVSFQIIDNEGTPITHVLNIDSEVPFCNIVLRFILLNYQRKITLKHWKIFVLLKWLSLTKYEIIIGFQTMLGI